MGTQSNSSIGSDKKNMLFVIILALAIIISILFWKTESAGEKLENAQFKLYGLRSDIDTKIVELDSLHNENKLITSQYQALKQNYLKLQKILVEKKKNLNSITNLSDRKQMASLLDELNGHLLNYETISTDLQTTTAAAVNNPNDNKILAENQRIAQELKIAELNNQILAKEKQLLNNRVNELQAKLESFGTTSTTNTAYLADLQTKFDAEQAKFEKLKTETDKILQQKDNELLKLNETTQTVKSLSESSFKAVYYFNEGKKTQKTVFLNKSDLHKSKMIKSIDVSFVLPEIAVNENVAKLSVLRKGDSGFEAYRFNQIDVPVNNLQGNLNLNIEPKLEKGEYKFVVNYNSKQIFMHEFVIK